MLTVPLLLLAVPIISTLIGGALALRLRRDVLVLTAIGAGILLGATFLDLLPEALTAGVGAGISSTNVLALTLSSFLLFYGLQGALDAVARMTRRRKIASWPVQRAGVAMLIFHSFRDGMAIGAAYAASHGAGYTVALGIAAHDLGDGMNTVLLSSGGDQPSRSTYAFLLADAIAPFLGGLLTSWWVFSQKGTVVLLVLAAGFFLQMATGDFLPAIQAGEQRRRSLVLAVFLGAAGIYLAKWLLGKYS